MRPAQPPLPLLTIGHSNRPLAAFLELVRAARVEGVADVRRHPASRRSPHFAGAPLAAALAEAGIAYRHLPELGGLRTPHPDSPHTALEDAFRGYADHMASGEFARGLAALLALAAARRTAVMCAEADPMHCHRRLLADLLVLRGHDVRHVIDTGPPRAHVASASARLVDGLPVYDGAQGRLGL